MSIINTYMKALLKRIQKFLKQKKGFTLIELLVVIGILGILAASLLITIDPFEQLKKGRDTTTKGAAVDYLDALTRYYATHGAFPWSITTPACTAPDAAKDLSDPNMILCTAALTGDGELKADFQKNTANTGVDKQIIVKSETGVDKASVHICFSPTSKSERSSPLSKYDSTCTDVLGTGCPSGTLATCYQEYK